MAKKAKKAAKKAPPKKAAKKAAPKKAAAKKSGAKATALSGTSKGVKGAPAGWHSLTPGCAIKRASSAVGFYEALFGAKVGDRMDGPDGTLLHATLTIGDSKFMVGEAGPQVPENTMNLMLYTADCDRVFHQATASGCSVIEGLTDQFWGDRSGRVKDPFGNVWMIATHVEDVSPAEMGRRFERIAKGQPWKAAA